MWLPDPDLELDIPLPLIRMPNGKVYQESVHDYQLDFHEDSSKFRAIVGSIASGKSAMGTIEVFQHCWQFRNNFGFILRETMPQNRLSSIRDFKQLCPKFMIRRHNLQDSTITLINQYGYAFMKEGGHKLRARQQDDMLEEIGGTSMIVFSSFEGTRDALQKWASANIGFYFIDQAERANEEIYEMLNHRLRLEPSRRQAWFCANWREDVPNESEWLWRLFSEESDEKRPHHTYREVITKVNQANLPDDFTESLDYAQAEHKKSVYVHGDKDNKMSRAVFPDYSPTIHDIPHQDPPSNWVKGIGLDHGLHNPTAFLEVALLPSGEVYVYDEYEMSGKVVSEHAKELLKRKTPQHLYWGIDPTTENREPIAGMSVLHEYHRWQLPFRPSARDVMAGINRIREYLSFERDRINPFTKQIGSPKLFISSRCVRLRQQLLSYRFEELKTHIGFRNEMEKPRKWNDHLVDALRFIFMFVTIPHHVTSEVAGFDSHRTPPVLNMGVKKNTMFNEKGQLDFSGIYEQALRPVSNRGGGMRNRSTSAWINATQRADASTTESNDIYANNTHRPKRRIYTSPYMEVNR